MGLSASQSRLLALTSRMSDLELRAQSISNSKVRLSDDSAAVSRDYSAALNKQNLKIYTGLSGSNNTATYADATFKNLTTYGSTSTTDKFRYAKTTSGTVVLTQQIAKLMDLNGTSSDTTCDHNIIPLNNFLTNCQKAGLISDVKATSASDVVYYTKLWNEVTENGTTSSSGSYVGNYVTPDGDNATTTQNENSSGWLQGQVDAGNIALYEYDSSAGSSGTGDYSSVSWTTGDTTLEESTDDVDTAKAEAAYQTSMSSIESKDKRFDVELNSINTEHSAIQTEIDSVKKVIDKNIERSFKIFDA